MEIKNKGKRSSTGSVVTHSAKSGEGGAVQTRYSFYQTENPIDLGVAVNATSNETLEIVSEETNDAVTNDNLNESYDQNLQQSHSTGDASESSSQVEDILRSLAEAESFRGKNDNNVKERVGISVKQGQGTSIHLSEPSGKPPIYDHGNMSRPSESNVNRHGTNAYEKAIRGALGYIRKRRQQRIAWLSVNHVAAAACCEGAGIRRSTNSDIPSVGLMSLPLSPDGIDDGSAALATATDLDSRLLSPPADLRKAALEMFRQNKNDDDKTGGGRGGEEVGDDCSDKNIDSDGEFIKPFKGLELAKPINSSYGRDSPMNPQTMETINSSAPNFSVVPSSPAPGKSHSLHLNENYESLKDLEIPHARKKALELERRVRKELDVQRGVEQVLLAILQQVESENKSNPEDTMETVLQLLLNEQEAHESSASPIDEFHYGLRKQNESRIDGETNLIEDNSGQVDETTSALDALEKDKYDVVAGENGMSEADDLCHDYKVEASSRCNSLSNDDGSFNESQSRDHEEDDDDDDDGVMDDMVLGPLSSKMGGTTGVVLQDDGDSADEDYDDNESDHASEYEPSPLGNKSASVSIMSSVSSAVMSSSNAIATKLSFGKVEKGLDRNEALIRTLYAHIMVRHPSKKSNTRDLFSKWLSDKFKGTVNKGPKLDWDDDDPDEPGYIVHTFTKARLQEIEAGYENMMERMQSEYTSSVHESSKGQNMVDSQFERDLLEAEKLFDTYTHQISSKSSKSSKVSTKNKDSNLPASSNDAPHTDSNFPAAKAAGTGNIGDLEIYHLPIIYKAHQTGFEPTKDLVLQPDSIFAGQYYVQSELGSAAFSTAYRCVDLTSGKKAEDGEVYYDEVCLKVIKNTKDFFDQSLDEIKILELLRQTGQCNENNILEMKAFFYHKEHLIIVTELLRQNLFEFGKYIMEHNEPQYFTRNRLCYIARQCLVALRFVHKLGLVHSDIKPENILLASYSRARVKVIDFGSSCYLTDRQSSYIQSRSYRAPEVILGLPYDGKIDVWSLGCVIAEMYTGQVTFQNDSVVSMLARIEAICGAFPRHMIDEGRQSGQFFTPTGLLYEKAYTDNDSGAQMNASSSFQDSESEIDDQATFNILQPKTTTMAERLGFDANLMTSKRTTWEEDEKALFTDFITKLLTIDPKKRLSAEEALEHPWILSGFNLTEEDLKYPPEE